MIPGVVAVLCARMDSERLPGKVLADMGGASILGHITRRLGMARSIRDCIIATSDEPGDDPIAAAAISLGVSCYRGSKNDVADRMDKALYGHGNPMVYRVMSDQPFVDWRAIDDAASLMAAHSWDLVLPMTRGEDPVYGAGTSPWSWRAWTRIASISTGEEREHVGMWLRRHLKDYDYGVLDLPSWAFRGYRLEIDTPDDLRFTRAIWSVWGKDTEPPLQDVIRLLDRDPSLASMNSHIREKTGTYISYTQAEIDQWESDYRDRPLVLSDLPSIIGDMRGPLNPKIRCPGCGGQLIPIKIRNNNLKLKCSRCGAGQTFYAKPPRDPDAQYSPWKD